MEHRNEELFQTVRSHMDSEGYRAVVHIDSIKEDAQLDDNLK